MKRLSIILLALSFLLPVMAQEDAASAAFERLVPSNVRLRLNEETGMAELVFNATPAVCEPLISEVTVEGNVIDVDAFVPLSAQDTTCNFIAPYEPVIELGELESDVSYVIFLNDFASTFFLPQVGGVIMDMPFSVLWGQDNNLIAFTRIDSFTTTVEITAGDSGVTLNVTGSHPDGCESIPFTWLRQDEVDLKVYHIEIFRLQPEGIMCPAVLQDFSQTIETGLSADETYFFESSEQWFAYSANAATLLLVQPLMPDTVTVVPDGNSFTVTVSAPLPDCSVEPTVAQASRDYASFISINMMRPLDAVCANLENPYQNEFTVDVLPVIINGIAYDENGILSPNASAAGGRDDAVTGGNIMQVDTVIESVDVLILESFPMQLDLVVKGYQPDGCDFPVIVEQSREGDVVTVHVYREVPSDVMCTMQIVPYEETIRLDGGFEGGTIEIHVNEFVTSVDL